MAWWCGVWLAVVLAAVPTMGQDLSLTPMVTREQLLADQFALLANQSLAGEGQPGDAQFTQCGMLLDAALTLTPDDAELLRFRVEIARRLGQRDVQLTALTAYCRLAPSDDAAQWRLIQLKLADDRLQTVEQRAAIVRRMLDAHAADDLSPALRSRMAAYLAAAAREAGDEATFAARLKQALQQDETNADAARLLYDWVTSRNNATPKQIDAALVALLRALPTDANVRRTLAERLLSAGAYAEAATQFAVFQALERQQTSLVGRLLIARAWASALAASGKFDEAAAMLDDIAATLEAIRVATAEAEQDVSQLPESLPPDVALVHVAVLDAADRVDDANAAFGRLRVALRKQKDGGDKRAAADMAWAALLFNRNVELVPDLLKEAGEVPTELSARLDGWQALRRGDVAATRATLQSVADADAFAAYGIAVSYRDADAVKHHEWLTRVASHSPGTLAGVLAAMDLRRMQQPVPTTAAAQALRAQLSRWPRRLVEPDAAHSTWAIVDVSVRHEAVNYLDPAHATITLRNAVPYAMAIGEHGSLPAQVAVFLTPRREGKLLGAMPPLVYDASRRIRLGPRESVRWDVRLDRALLGSMLTTLPTDTITYGVVAVADPWVSGDASISAGPTGSIAAVHATTRRGLANTPENLARWLAELDTPTDVAERLRAIARLMVFIATPTDDVAAGALQKQAADRINDFAVNADASQHAWLARFLASDGGGVRHLAPTRQILVRSTDANVQMMLLTTQVTRADDPLLTAALRDGGAKVRAFAAARRDALTPNEGLE